MSTEVCLLALNCAMNEIKGICPAIQSAFMFKQNKEILAHDRETDEPTINEAITTFFALNKRVNTQGGVNAATFTGLGKRIVFTRVDSFYLATVAGNTVDERTLKTISGMLIPTILRVLDVVHPAFIATQAGTSAIPDTEIVKEDPNEPNQLDLPVNETKEVSAKEQTQSFGAVSDLLLPEPPVHQFMVENISGIGRLIAPSDIIYVESSVIAHWENLYGNRRIKAVQVEETRTGKHQLFKFKPLKDSKLEGKGVIQMPEKAQLSLEIQKGALVTVKPVIDQTEASDD